MDTTVQPTGCQPDPLKFDALIANLGIDVQYRPAMRCACYREASVLPDPACTLCFPYGVVWSDPVSIVAFGPNRRPTRRPDLTGVYEASDVFFTFQTGFTPTYGSRLTLPDTTLIVDDTLTRGKSDVVRYPTCQKLLAAWYTQRNPPTGDPYVNEKVNLTPDVDVALDPATGAITFTNPNVPAAGTRYVVQVQARSQYFVWEVQDRAAGGTVMPYRALCKRLDYFLHPRGNQAVRY